MNKLTTQNNLQAKKPTPNKIAQAQGLLVTLNRSRELEEANKQGRRDSGANSQQGIYRKQTTPRTFDSRKPLDNT